MRIQDAKIISANAAEECTGFDDEMDGEIISILGQHITEIPDNKRGGTRMMHTILVKHQNGEIRRHFAPGMYGQGTSLRIENFFKLYPTETMDCRVVKREVPTRTGSFFRWLLEDVPSVSDNDDESDAEWRDACASINTLMEVMEDHDSSLPGSVGGAMTDTQTTLTPKRSGAAF